MNSTPHPHTLRAFVLDQLDDDARASLEAQVLHDEDLFARLREVEDDLLESYVRGTLDTATRGRVASTLLAGPDGQARLAVAEGLHQRTLPDQPSHVEGSFVEIEYPRLAVALAATVVLALFAGWLGMRMTRLDAQVQQLEQERTALIAERDEWTRERQALGDAIGVAEQRANNLAEEVAARVTDLETLSERLRATTESAGRAAAKAPLTVALALSLGVRGTAPPVLAIPQDATTVRLQVELEQDALFDHYRAVLSGARGVQVWADRDLRSTTQPWGALLTLDLPESVLVAGPYSLAVRGRESDGHTEDVGFYSFTIVRR